MKRTLINPPGIEGTYETWKFSQAVKVGDTIWVSGQVGFGPDGVPEDFIEQARLVFENLKRVLEHAGASLADVVRTRMYVMHIREDWEAIARAHGEVFKHIRPATSMVEVSGLIDQAMLVEIEADALISA